MPANDLPAAGTQDSPPLRFGLKSLFALTAAVVIFASLKFGESGFLLTLLYCIGGVVIWVGGTKIPTVLRLVGMAAVGYGVWWYLMMSNRVCCVITHHPCQSSLRQLGLAIRGLESNVKTIPAAYTLDSNGNPLHSWRTTMLPYIEEPLLFKQIDLNQPWNSPRNFAACQTPIKLFQCFADKRITPAGASYVAVIAPGSVWEPVSPRRIGAIQDNHADTLLLVEWHDSGIQWAEPRDLDLRNTPQWLLPWIPKMLARHHGKFVGVFVDGHVEFIPGSIPEDQWKAILTRNGGEVVDRAKW